MIYSAAKMQDQVRTAVVTDFYTVQFVWLQILGSSLGNYLHPRNFIIFLSAIKIIGSNSGDGQFALCSLLWSHKKGGHKRLSDKYSKSTRNKLK